MQKPGMSVVQSVLHAAGGETATRFTEICKAFITAMKSKKKNREIEGATASSVATSSALMI